MAERKRKSYYLVQRLRRPIDSRTKSGFSYDYMGAHQFEDDGALKALQRIRDQELIIHEGQVEIGGKTAAVFLLCDPAEEAVHWEAFIGWIEDGCKGQESSHFPQIVSGVWHDGRPIDGDRAETLKQYVAWWSLASVTAWTMNRQDAEELLVFFSNT